MIRRRRRVLAAIVVLVILTLGGAALYYYRDLIPPAALMQTTTLEPEAPPDLEKLRDKFRAGVEAVHQDDGDAAIRNLGSFTFGKRAVEEYRLYFLANAHQLNGNTSSARVTLAKLWRRSPKMIHAGDAAFTLGNLYATIGDWTHSGDVYAALARTSENRAISSEARQMALRSRLQTGDLAAAYYAARSMLIHEPASEHAGDAAAIVRALSGLDANAEIPLTPSERLDRAINLRISDAPAKALDELTRLEAAAPSLRHSTRLQRGIALHQLKRYEESNKVLEPLTSGAFKVSIPALQYAAKNYAIVAGSIDPFTYKTVKEKKRVGTVKVRVGKGKKRRTVSKPKYQTVFRKVQLVDLPKKKKKEEYERLSSERLKDLLSLKETDEETRLIALDNLIARAEAKNQDEYLRELVPQVIAIERDSDPALQHFWDKGWAAYARGDLATAQKTFRFIFDTYTHPNVKRQSRYWYARVIERLGEKEEASTIYRELASAPYADLYAIHASNRGAPLRPEKSNPLKKTGADWGELADKQMPPELRLAYELTSLAAMREANLEIRANQDRRNTRFAEALLADVHHSAGNAVSMFRSLRKAWPQLATVEQDTVPVYFLAMYYPQAYGDSIEKHAKTNGLDPNLVRALILQESYYNPQAKSRVGATGLMQLMAPTATDHGRKLHIRFAASRLENPDVNVQLGTYHLRMLIRLFSGNEYLAIAAYNGGQGNVAKWRRAVPRKPLDEFLESIPFPETRNYVKRVTMLRSAYARLTS